MTRTMTASSRIAIVLAIALLCGSVGVCAFLPTNHHRSRSRANAARSSSRRPSALSMSAALIVQNKGGGHGELGFQLAKALSSNDKITSVTILQDEACDSSKQPFVSYAADIPSVRIVNAPLGDDSTDAATLQSLLGEGESYDYVWDNASKGPEGAGKAICDMAKNWDVKLLTYVSSAGMYLPDDSTTFPMTESTPIKETSGQALFDAYAVECGLPLVSFRPQYIYGPKSNKYTYIDWYFDRIIRKLPLPIPGDGTQKVSLTNSEDVALLLASVLNDEAVAATTRYFNCGTNDFVSYDEVAYLCADAAGVAREDVNIQHYDAGRGKAAFPFRLTDFYVSPDMAMTKLGWGGPTHSLKGDLGWYYEGYVARGMGEKELDTTKDEEVLKELV